jgi:16S rRNA processing protein RimM
MTTTNSKYLLVGKIANTHGLRGELKVWPETDFPDVRFAKGSSLLLVHPEDESKMEQVKVAAAREQKGLYLIKFDRFDNINEVERFKGWSLMVPSDKRAKLEQDEYYFHDIIGCVVVSEEGETIGEITDILRPGANDVWVVARPKGKPVYLPYIDDVVLSVDIANKMVTIRVMEGLLE